MSALKEQEEDTIYDVIRRNIRKYRRVDLSHDFIRQIESEKARYNFSVETFWKISVALGVGMDQLAMRPPESPADGE